MFTTATLAQKGWVAQSEVPAMAARLRSVVQVLPPERIRKVAPQRIQTSVGPTKSYEDRRSEREQKLPKGWCSPDPWEGCEHLAAEDLIAFHGDFQRKAGHQESKLTPRSTARSGFSKIVNAEPGMLQMSMGSLSHPAFCHSPCVHMIKNGYCDAGASCGFCHLPHSKKVRLNKHQRQFLHSLDAGQKVVFIVPIIIQKMEGFPE
eukprot:s569_g1.t1